MGVGADRPVIPETIPRNARGVSRVAMSRLSKAGAVANRIMEIPVSAISD
jgi:hypothetical protein